jgi:serine/threonine protein phosphatase PrpC
MRFPFFRIKEKREDQTGSAVCAPELETGAATDPGRKRRGEPNQDGMLILPAEAARPLLLIVADGMGGYAGGAEASQLVIDAAASWYKKKKKNSDPASLLKDCILQAHRDLVKHAKGKSERMSMGSTLVAAVVDGAHAYIANVGDSRAYLLRGEEIILLSYDHSVVADRVRAGRMTPLQALQSPLRNRLTQSITPKRKSIKPYVTQAAFSGGDILLLCTDGLWGVVTEAVMQTVAREMAPQAAADKLVELTLALGAPDNVTVVIARRGGEPLAAAAAEDKEKTLVGIAASKDSDITLPGAAALKDSDITLPGISLRGKMPKNKTESD